MNRYARIALLIVIALLSIGFASAQTLIDNFDRADSASLGGNWTETESGGTFSITSNRMGLSKSGGGTANAEIDFSAPSNFTIEFVSVNSVSRGIEFYIENGTGGGLIADYQIYNGDIKVRTSRSTAAFVTIATYGNGQSWNMTIGNFSNSANGLYYSTWINDTLVDSQRESYWTNGNADDVGQMDFQMISPWDVDMFVNEICVDSTELGCVTATPPSSSGDNFTVEAIDAYSSASITGFNVTFEDLGITTTQTLYNETTNYGTQGKPVTEFGATYNTTTWAYDFDGVNDYLGTNVTTTGNFNGNTNYAAYVKFKSGDRTSENYHLLGNGEGTVSNRNAIIIGFPGELEFRLGGTFYGTNYILDDEKIHSVLLNVFNNGTGYEAEIYINGTKRRAGIAVGSAQVNNEILIGALFGGTTETYNGTIYDVRLYSNLSDSDINNVFNNEPTEQTPVFDYRFINFSSVPQTFDYSGQGNTLTNNGATYNSSSEAFNFDGTNDYIDLSDGGEFSFNSTQAFTIQATAKRLGTASFPVVSVWGTTGGARSWLLWYNSGSQYKFLDNAGGDVGFGTSSSDIVHLVGVYDGAGTMNTYLNGVFVTSGSFSPTDVNQNLWIGRLSNSYANGSVYEVGVYNIALNNTDIFALYNNESINKNPILHYTFQNSTVGDVTVNGIPNYFGNTTQNVNTSAVHTSKHTRYPEALFYDAYTGLNISSFNVTINATTYTTTNGTLYIPYKDLVGTSSATKYFQSSNTISNRTEYLSHYASITGFNAYDKVSGQNVSTFQANTTSEGGTATNNSYLPSLYTTYGNFTAELNKAGYYQAYTTYEAQPQTSQEANFTVYNHKANFTITIGIGGSTANNYTIDIYDRNNYSFHEQRNTTTGHLTFNLSHGNYTAIINDTIHTLTRYNFTLEETNNRSNFTITTYTTNTVNITFIDEETNRIITQGDQNATVTAYITGSQASYNFTDIINGSLLAEMINPQDYTITYSATGYGQREKHFTLTNRTYEYLTLYLLNESTEDLILFTVRDNIGTPTENATIRAQRKNLSGTNYYEVDNCVTGTEGTCTMRLILYDPTYRFVVDYNGATVKTTTDQKITSTSVIITIDLTTDQLAEVQALYNINGNVTYNNNTETFTFTWNNPAGTNVQGCMEVTARKAGIYTTLNNTNCGTSSSGSVTYTINESRYDEFTAKGYVTIDGTRRLVDTLGIVTGGFGTGAGANGLFIFGFFILGTLAMAMLWNPIAAPIVLVGGLALFSFAGIISVPMASIGGLIALVIGFIALSNR